MRTQGGWIRLQTKRSPRIEPFVADNAPFTFDETAAAEEVIV